MNDSMDHAPLPAEGNSDDLRSKNVSELIGERFAKVAQRIRAGEKVTASPREIISWVYAERRGVRVNASVRRHLRDNNLKTIPGFEYEYIDGVVTFKLIEPSESTTTTSTTAEPETDSTTTTINPNIEVVDEDSVVELPLNEGLITTDPTYRIGKLPAANKKPFCVKPNDSIEKAVTLMLEHDFSQLPVITNPSTVEGLFTWESLATFQHFKKTPQNVGECMVKAHVISSEISIFDAIEEIAVHNLVLVRAPNRMITGIVTTFDLSHQFRQLGEPFLLLGEIENQMRRLLDGCFTLVELTAIRAETDAERTIESISDLTFGEYLRLIENQDNWSKLSLPLDRPEFVNRLDDVRVIRNNVMHFDPDGIAEDDLDTLRKFARFLQRVVEVRSPNTTE